MRLTNNLLKRIIKEEMKKFGDMESAEDRADNTKEVDADEYGADKTLAKKIDFIKALKIEETRLRNRIAKISETRRRVARSI